LRQKHQHDWRVIGFRRSVAPQHPGDYPLGPAIEPVSVTEADGLAEIAAALHLSVAAVKAHVCRLLDKLDVDNRVQIALLVQSAREH
jgi:hypothetical protein